MLATCPAESLVLLLREKRDAVSHDIDSETEVYNKLKDEIAELNERM